MTDLKIRNISSSDLKLFLIKGALWKEFEAGFLYNGVSCMRKSTVFTLFKMIFPHINLNQQINVTVNCSVITHFSSALNMISLSKKVQTTLENRCNSL